MVTQPQVEPRPTSDGPAIAALILGIAGVFTFGVTAVVGVILGHATRRRTRSRGLSTAAIVVSWSVLAIALGLFTLFVLFGGLLSGGLVDTSQFDS